MNTQFLVHVYITDTVYTITTTTVTSAPPPAVTTLASELVLHNKTTVIILVGSLLLGIPFVIICVCLVRSLIAYRREKKIKVNEDEMGFYHPPPAHPPPRPFLQRDNTIAGPFRNPTFHDEDNGDDGDPSRTVVPSFVSTRVVDEPSFGTPPQRYKYIP